MTAPHPHAPKAEDSLTVDPQHSARERLKYLFWVRFSSAGALLIPTVAATAFVWERTRVTYDALPDGQMVVNTLSQGANYIFWTLWIPVALCSFGAGLVCAWLSWRALNGMRRRVRFHPHGLEIVSVFSSLHLPWSAIEALEAGDMLTFRYSGGTLALKEDWAGREALENVLVYAKGRLPKERIAPAPTAAEAVLAQVNKILPYAFLALLAALSLVLLYWGIFRRQSF